MQPTPATTRFFGIPELVGHLAYNHLDHKSISHLMRTSRHLHSFCAPALYYHVYDNHKPKKSLFASKEAMQALFRNVDHVRYFDLSLVMMVYYVNCVFAYQDQPPTLPPPGPADGLVTGEQEAKEEEERLIRSRRPRWLAPPDPQICTLFPIPPMTFLTKLNLYLGFPNPPASSSSDRCPYSFPSLKDPRATLTQTCWILHSNPHLLNLRLTSLLIKDRRDIRLLSKALFGLKRLQMVDFDIIRWDEDWGGRDPRATRGLALAIFFACSPALRNLYFEVLTDDNYWEEEVTTEYRRMGQDQPLSWEMSDGDDGDGDGDDKENKLAVPRLRKEPMAHLASLQLCFLGEEDLSEAEFRSMLEHCPNLTTIVVPPVHSIRHPRQLAQEIGQQLCPKLTIVKKESFAGDYASWELVFWILDALPEQQVQIFDCQERSFLIPGLTSQAAGSMFRRQSGTLRKIELAGCQNIDSRAIQSILVECVTLERLGVQPRPMEFHQQNQPTLCINLDDAIEFPWGCTRIKDLTLTIAIPDEPLHRSEEMGVVPYYNRPPPTTLSPAETAQFQSLEAFYRQLGALTESERLELRATYYDPAGNRTVDAMFRLNSFPGMLNLKNEETGRPGYLHLLGRLTKLRALFGSVSVTTEETKETIGMDEVKWMDKHWPMLKKAHFFTNKNEKMFSEPFKWFLQQQTGGKKTLQFATSV